MNTRPDSIETERRYDSGRSAILNGVAEGTFDPGTSPGEIAEQLGLDKNTVDQLYSEMFDNLEINWIQTISTPSTPTLILTEAGKEHLAQLAETC